MPTQLCFGPAMHPWPSRRGTAVARSGGGGGKATGRRTAVESATDCCDDDLDAKETPQKSEHLAVLFVDAMDPNNMNGWEQSVVGKFEGKVGRARRRCKEKGRADGLEKIELLASLWAVSVEWMNLQLLHGPPGTI